MSVGFMQELSLKFIQKIFIKNVTQDVRKVQFNSGSYSPILMHHWPITDLSVTGFIECIRLFKVFIQL